MSDECGRCQVKGRCCEYLELQLAAPLSGDVMRWVELHDGLTIHERDGATFLHIDEPCGALTADGDCVLVGTPDRPRMCSVWPGDDPERYQAPEGCVFLEEYRQKRFASLDPLPLV